MKGCYLILGVIIAAVGSVSLIAQSPVLSSIEAPYANLPLPARIAGQLWAPGTVAYGPVGTPLILIGWNFGSSGTVTFTPYKNGAVDPNAAAVDATVTTWTAGMLTLTVPTGAFSGTIEVTSGGVTSNALPFMVTSGSYLASCPTQPPPQTTSPTITSLNPSSGNVGLSVKILGSSFGAIQGAGTVTFNGTSAGVLNWSDSSVTAVVPGGATTGPVVVKLENGQMSNNNFIFTVGTSPCN